MAIGYRPFKNESDFDIQRSIFLQATKGLLWAWKPNKTQERFFSRPNFDPNSKLFAYDGDEPIGYESCVNWNNETPIGYPWMLPNLYKIKSGEIQNHLFDTVYNYAINNFNSRFFIQRFRKEWIDQICFFEEKGFSRSRSYPIFIRELKTQNEYDFDPRFEHSILDSIGQDILKITKYDSRLKKEDDNDIIQYYDSDLDLDCIIQTKIKSNSKAVGISGMASRDDTGYSEIMLFAIHSDFPEASSELLQATIRELGNRQYQYCSTTLNENDSQVDYFKQFNFRETSESVYYTKQL
ncbi:MAG: hypothetical protein ACFFE8_01005 [Candidatus Heimdallarchaeota archaeon]